PPFSFLPPIRGVISVGLSPWSAPSATCAIGARRLAQSVRRPRDRSVKLIVEHAGKRRVFAAEPVAHGVDPRDRSALLYPVRRNSRLHRETTLARSYFSIPSSSHRRTRA